MDVMELNCILPHRLPRFVQLELERRRMHELHDKRGGHVEQSSSELRQLEALRADLERELTLKVTTAHDLPCPLSVSRFFMFHDFLTILVHSIPLTFSPHPFFHAGARDQPARQRPPRSAVQIPAHQAGVHSMDWTLWFDSTIVIFLPSYLV